jgi:hypothetical protein
VAEAVTVVTRDSYGRLLALLAAPGRDIASAEDALADALERAVTHWEADGIPANPAAWIHAVAGGPGGGPGGGAHPVARPVEVPGSPPEGAPGRE